MALIGVPFIKTALRVGVAVLWAGLVGLSAYVEMSFSTPSTNPLLWAVLGGLGITTLVVTQWVVSKSMTRAADWEGSEEGG